MALSKILNDLTSNPKKLFLTDSLGALLTAFFLGVILAQFETVFGMPKSVLYGLTAVACVYAVYSFICYLFVGENWRLYLKIIAIANFLYGCLTVGLVIYHFEKLTIFGLIYFFLELVVLGGVVMIERRAFTEKVGE